MTVLTEFNDPQHIAPYNGKTGVWLVSQMRNASGDVIQTVIWEVRKEKFPCWSANATGLSEPPVFPPGDYTLSWLIEGVEFWQLPFTIAQQAAERA